MKSQVANLPAPLANFLFFVKICLLLACSQPATSTKEADEKFFKEKNDQHGGDYLASFPLLHPDSCILKLKNEVPEHLQPWCCFSIWYRIPRNHPDISLRWLDLYEKNYPHDTVSAFAQMVRGEFMVELGKGDSARLLLADARTRYLKLGRVLDASDADYLLGQHYANEQHFAKALETFHGVLTLLDRHDTTFSHRHAVVCRDIATTYAIAKDFRQAIFWNKKILYGNPAKLDPAWRYKAQAANKLSTNYAQLEQFDSSLYMSRRAIELYQANSKKPLPAEFLYHLGFAHWKKGDCAAALPSLQQAARTPVLAANNALKNQIEQVLGVTYTCLGRLDSAELYLRKTLANPDTLYLAISHVRLADILARRSRFREAYEAERAGGVLFKTAFQIEKATALSEYQARYETAELAHRVAQLEANNKISRQRIQIFALLGLLVLIVFGALFFRQRNRQRILEQEKQILEKNKTLLEQEKQLAQALAQLKTQELERSETSLKLTKDELETTARLLELKSQLIEELEMRLHEQFAAPSDNLDSTQPRASETEALYRMKILTEGDWSRFRERFEQAFPGFLTRLKIQFPNLSAAETRLFLLGKLKFNLQETAETLGISLDSVYRSRHRLSKKIGLVETGELDAFVANFN